ncbi:MAG: right-handed parallel beta-helix repeat-containing protein [Kiritimatiellales bacterium]
MIVFLSIMVLMSSSLEIETSTPVGTLTALSPGRAAQVNIVPGVYQLPAAGLRLNGLTDVTIQASNVTFIATDPQRTAISLFNCTNVVFHGLTLDYDPLPFTQGTLTAVDTNSYTADFTIHAGYPDLDEVYLSNRVHLFDAVSRRWKPGAPDYYIIRIEPVNSRQGRIFFRQTDSGFPLVAPGDHIALNIRNAGAVYVREGCDNVCFEDVTIHTAPGIAMMIRFAESAGKFNRTNVIPGPLPDGAVEPRLLSSCADAFNSGYTRTGPVLTDCEFSFMADDGINLHGVTLPVLKWEDSRTCISMRPSADPFQKILRPGDTIRFLREPDYRLVASNRIASISLTSAPDDVDWYSIMTNTWSSVSTVNHAFYRIVLEQEPELDDFSTPELFIDAPAVSSAGYEIRNNYFHDHRGRGLRLMAGNGLVESNRLERIKGAAISLGPEFISWREAGWVNDITVRNNIIQDVGQGLDITFPASYTLGAISVFARVLPQAAQTVYYCGNRNITITGNTINGCSLDGISVVAAYNTLIESNTIQNVNQKLVPTAGSSYGLQPGKPINVLFSEETEIRDNHIL